MPPTPPESAKILAPDGNRYHFIHDQIEVGGETAFIAENIEYYTSHGGRESEIFLVHGKEVRSYSYLPGRLSAIDNKLTYSFRIDVRDPRTGHNKAEYPIRHGDEVYGRGYETGGHFIEFDNKVTFLAKQVIPQAQSDLEGGDVTNRMVGFLVQNDVIVSDMYENVDSLVAVEDKLMYHFKEDGLWYLNVNGKKFGAGYDSNNSFGDRYGYFNEKPVFFVNQNEKWFLVYGDRIVSDGYEIQPFHRGLTPNGVVSFMSRSKDNWEGTGVTVWIDLSSFD